MKYEICLTIKPLWYRLPPPEQFELALKYLNSILEGYEVSLVAELTQEHNVHFHGILELKDHTAKDRFLNKFRGCKSSFFGKKSCSQLMFEDSYKKYMKKDLELTKQIIRDPIVRDDFGIFKTIFEYTESGGDRTK